MYLEAYGNHRLCHFAPNGLIECFIVQVNATLLGLLLVKLTKTRSFRGKGGGGSGSKRDGAKVIESSGGGRGTGARWR